MRSAANTKLPHNKLGARKVRIDGITFDSQKEGRRYLDLKMMQLAGEITHLKCHPRFELAVNGQKICEFWPDFMYWKDGQWCVEDVKGRRAGVQYQLFRVKAKLFQALHGIEVKVV